MKFKRIFVIVMDSVGAGAAKDAAAYGDEGTNTLNHASYSLKEFKIPTLESLGLGKITDINNTRSDIEAKASYGKLEEMSVGKDTLTGHWEMMGLDVKVPFPSFTEHGFPKELIDKLEAEIGRKTIGNYAASGTEIIKVLGPEHMKTGAIIVYTSSDSVLQIAANEAIVPVTELYSICDKARKICSDNPKWMVGRIIARPFIGTAPDNFVRTANRHDYSVSPSSKTTLDYLKKAGYDVIGIGKISDIFNTHGITESYHNESNHNGMEHTIYCADKDFTGLCFVNLVDFDSKYGHRRNAQGYAKCIMEFDNDLSELLKHLRDDDLLMITADHGNDPTHTGTDHTRENVPILVYNKNIVSKDLGLIHSFSSIGKTISNNFGVKSTQNGNKINIKLK
ncbi:MAG: phosphopentomutase [Bacilli bacterium]